jgi:hypothetical protein
VKYWMFMFFCMEEFQDGCTHSEVEECQSADILLIGCFISI